MASQTERPGFVGRCARRRVADAYTRRGHGEKALGPWHCQKQCCGHKLRAGSLAIAPDILRDYGYRKAWHDHIEMRHHFSLAEQRLAAAMLYRQKPRQARLLPFVLPKRPRFYFWFAHVYVSQLAKAYWLAGRLQICHAMAQLLDAVVSLSAASNGIQRRQCRNANDKADGRSDPVGSLAGKMFCGLKIRLVVIGLIKVATAPILAARNRHLLLEAGYAGLDLPKMLAHLR